MEEKMQSNISKRQLERYPMYLNHLFGLKESGEVMTSAPKIARALGLNVEQVRKDLQAISSKVGRPKFGREIDELISDLKSFLGYNSSSLAIVVGVGHLGQAFMNFKGFNNYGLDIVMGFDCNPDLFGKSINGKPIYNIDDMSAILARHNIKIAILTTPLEAAQEVSNLLINCGIKGIWNFTGAFIYATSGVVIEDMNLASSLAKFSHRLQLLKEKENC